MSESEFNSRVLIVDDNRAIHEDFVKILSSQDETDSFDVLAQELFPDRTDQDSHIVEKTDYQLDHAYQGRDALEMIEEQASAGKPYALVFMDVRMPPGWDGIESIKRIWAEHPDIEMVICTAYSDYSWEEILKKVGTTDQLMFLRKPFDVISVKQMALALTKKWNLAAKARSYVDDLERSVAERTKDLTEKIGELEKAVAEIRTLQGILPMCIYCHKIREDENYWQRVDEYIQTKTIANVSHSVCPDCYSDVMDRMLDEIAQEQQADSGSDSN